MIEHKCGAMFNVNTIKIIESSNFGHDRPLEAIQLRCPGCFQEMATELKNKLLKFSKAYTKLIEAFGEEGFDIKEMKITNEASDS